jgi:hypothetical protein
VRAPNRHDADWVGLIEGLAIMAALLVVFAILWIAVRWWLGYPVI